MPTENVPANARFVVVQLEDGAGFVVFNLTSWEPTFDRVDGKRVTRIYPTEADADVAAAKEENADHLRSLLD